MGKRRSLALPFGRAIEKLKTPSAPSIIPRTRSSLRKRSPIALWFKAALKLSELSEKENDPPETAVVPRRTLIPCPPNLDPLVNKAYHNNAVSPLCRIPDELLLMIMGNLSYVDLALLRRTSRIFLRLFADHRFKHLQGRQPGVPWPVMSYVRFMDTRQIHERLWADKYCAACFNRRINRHHNNQALSLSLVKTGCAGCGAVHSQGLFSPYERLGGDPRRKVCIAHEGHLRVCQHRVITWPDIHRRAGSLTAGGPPHEVRVCRAQSHILPCGKSSKSVGGDGVAVRVELKKDGRIRVTVEWVVHASVPWRSGAPGIYDADDVRRIATGLQADAGRFIVPNLQPGDPPDPPHMAAVDPNYCGCLHYPGRGLLDWQMVPMGRIRDSCCRKTPSRGLFRPRRIHQKQAEHEAHVARWEVGTTTRQRTYTIMLKRCCEEKEGMGVEVTHRQTFTLSCHPPRLGPAQGRMTWAPHEWFGIMDPGSYGLEGDPASKNTLWCYEWGCANHVSRIGENRYRDMVSLKPYPYH